jgi:hypothetical protein
MSFTNYTEAAVLNHIYGSTTFAKPSAIYIGLFTAAPTEAGGGTEVSGNAYVRMLAAFTVAGTSPTTASLASQIEWPAATADWGTITHFATFDAATGGNMLSFAALTVPKTVLNGDIFRFESDSISITLD